MLKLKTTDRRPIPPVEELDRRFSYDPLTGCLWHKLNVAGNVRAGDRAGHKGGVYINSISYATGRIIWKMMTGDEPPIIVDHKDGDHLNFKWSNLRAADYARNKQNRAYDPSRSKTGVRGVVPGRRYAVGKFVAYIGSGKSYKTLGTFDTLEEAKAARLAAEIERYGEYRTDRVV